MEVRLEYFVGGCSCGGIAQRVKVQEYLLAFSFGQCTSNPKSLCVLVTLCVTSWSKSLRIFF